jgi:ribose/xylose/arabinose/galactoside ABC-type transport system permease subunit
MNMSSAAEPLGVRALSVFFAFGACMSGLSLAGLLMPGSALDAIWRINPAARDAFELMGSWALMLMSVVFIACALASWGLLRRSPWGRRLAIGILSLNAVEISLPRSSVTTRVP